MSRTVVSDLVRNSATAALGDTYIAAYNKPLVEQAVAQVSTDVDTALDSVLESLRAEARALGASNAQVDAIFAKVGVNHDPEPEPEVVEETQPESKKAKKFAALQAEVDALKDTVTKALAFARRNGYTG